ncbi:hypothetical protein NDR87_20145 [Nocardia sp. CDC159]|uniref:Uncharacterized protein n=1 Tax=Nocardia pulmonis TaxID=2951408 RepID=A0A9X2E802_9NOCA|nr:MULTISPECIES: hypothetical protein [Nocardia]MCM6775992.1 hypothetical protein [Nocardia pulmonis]MCM6788681.1 hypothetical protein [Nocardia sp. CDC159]
MRIRTVVATVGTAVVGGAIAATVTAGPAAAFRPIINDARNGIVVGVGLDHGETVAVANSPIPALLDQAFPNTQYWMDPASQLPQDDEYVYADLPAVFTETARDPQGQIAFAVVNPAMYEGHNSIIVQDLG